MSRSISSFLVILALLPITVAPAMARAVAGVDRIESVAHHRLDVFGLAEAPRADAASIPRPPTIVALRLADSPTAVEPGAIAAAGPAVGPRRDGARRRCPEPRARSRPDDPAH